MATLSALARLLSIAAFDHLSSSSCSLSNVPAKVSERRSPAVLVAVFALFLLGARQPVHAQNAAQSGLSSLPAAAQGSVSAALGSDDSRYWLHAAAGSFHAANPEHALTANFSRHGVEISSKGAQWDFALRGYGYGNNLVRTGQSAPHASKNRVEYVRGPLTEWYINGPLGLEQGFTLAKPPGKTSGQLLTVALSLSGNLTAAVDPSGSSLTLKRQDGKTALRVGSLMAYDATGRQLHGEFSLRGAELLLQVNDAGAQYPVVLDPLVQQAELTAADGAAADQFGYSVAISGYGASTVLVGAPYHAVNGNNNQGAVYVFTFSAGSWVQQPDLTAADGALGDYFGSSVALSGDGNTALIGALGHTVNGNNQGAAYVFTYSAGTWSQIELTASDGASEDAFGASLSLSNDATTALIGAPAHNNQGAAYVFTLSGTWSQQQELTASDIALSDAFGTSVALGGDATALIGSPYHAVNGNNFQGAAYVFSLSGTWVQQQELTASDGVADDIFGSAVALTNTGTTALIGAPLAAINGNIYAGAAYVFTLSGTWSQQQELSVGTPEEGFGNSVALAGNGAIALVGASLSTINGASNQGAAYTYTLAGSTWSLQQQLTAPDGAANDYFGNSVALSNVGSAAVVGALDHAVNGNASQGAAYAYNTPFLQLTATPTSLNFPDIVPAESFAKVVVVRNTGPSKLTLGAISLTPTAGDPNAFTIYRYCLQPGLRAGGTCTIRVVFRPHQLGLSTATLNVPFNGPGSPLEVPITGKGVTRKR